MAGIFAAVVLAASFLGDPKALRHGKGQLA